MCQVSEAEARKMVTPSKFAIVDDDATERVNLSGFAIDDDDDDLHRYKYTILVRICFYEIYAFKESHHLLFAKYM